MTGVSFFNTFASRMALYMENLIKYDESDVRGKAFCLDKGEKPEAGVKIPGNNA